MKQNALSKSAKGQPCTGRFHCCNGNWETTVLAHAGYPGRFGSRKHWWWSMYLCSDCHDYIDNRASVLTRREIKALCHDAIHETQERMIGQKLINVVY